MKPLLLVSLLVVVLGLAGIWLVLTNTESVGNDSSDNNAYEVRPYVEVVNPSGFVNTNGAEITFEEFIGEKVILFDFMTYSCINCQRTFPYLNAWYEAYKDDGLIVIGVHTPEFVFERDITNVEEGLDRFGIEFPVILDNEYATWRAYGNRFWPRKYLIDIHGNIVYDHIGEGAYEETEAKIIELLEERQEVLGLTGEIQQEGIIDSLDTQSRNKKSPETYIGNARNEYLLNSQEDRRGLTRFTIPETIESGGFYLGGTWGMTAEYAESVSESVLTYTYEGQEVYLVAGADAEVEIEVWQDGKLVTQAAGDDVVNGILTIQKNRLYKLIKNEEAGEYTLELRVKGAGARLFAFTFG